MRIIALIPARSGSKRVEGKNMALLNGKPLLQYTIDAAKKSRVFDEIVLTSNWDKALSFGKSRGITPLRRPDHLCLDESHDYEFVKHALNLYRGFDLFVILRPTSPFRTAETIKRAVRIFRNTDCDSIRAVNPTVNHPAKSWILASDAMIPYMGRKQVNGFPCYDMPTQALGNVYCQNGCIHIAWTETVKKYGNVSGRVIAPFFTEGNEGIDINTMHDLKFAEWIMRGEP